VDALVIAHREAETAQIPENGNAIAVPFEKVGNCVVVKSHRRGNWSIGRLDIDLRPGKDRSPQTR